MKPFDIYVAAVKGAIAALPPETVKRVGAYEDEYERWQDAGWPCPVPPALRTASDAVVGDPLAVAYNEILALKNRAFVAERKTVN